MFYDEMIYAIKFTERCNLNCNYCMVKDDDFEKQDLDLETYEELIKKTFGFRKITIYAIGGEPTLLGADYFRKIKAINEKYSNEHTHIDFFINTNMLLYDDEFDKIGLGLVPKWDGKNYSKPIVLEKITKYASSVSAVNCMGAEYLLDDLDESINTIAALGITVNVFPDIYLGEVGLNKLAKILLSNKNSSKILLMKDIKRMVRKKPTSTPATANLMNNNFCMLTNGDFRMGGPAPIDNKDNYIKNIYEIDHIIDMVFSEKMFEYNKGYLKSLRSKDSLETNAGGFFAEKLALGIDLDQPNSKMVDFCKLLMEG